MSSSALLFTFPLSLKRLLLTFLHHLLLYQVLPPTEEFSISLRKMSVNNSQIYIITQSTLSRCLFLIWPLFSLASIFWHSPVDEESRKQQWKKNCQRATKRQCLKQKTSQMRIVINQVISAIKKQFEWQKMDNVSSFLYRICLFPNRLHPCYVFFLLQ